MLRKTAAAIVLLAACSVAQAQRIQRPLNRPTVSPYVNLLRSGSGTGLNYYGLVRPELQFGQSLQQLQLGLGGLQRRTSRSNPFGGFGGGMGVTGHAVVFDSYRSGGPGIGGAGFTGGGFGGFAGGGSGFSLGFLTGGSFGAIGFGGGNSSFSPLNGGALQGSAAGGANFGGQTPAVVGPSGVNSAAGISGQSGQSGQTGTSQPGTPWGRGSIGPVSGSTGHPVIFDSYRQLPGGQ